MLLFVLLGIPLTETICGPTVLNQYLEIYSYYNSKCLDCLDFFVLFANSFSFEKDASIYFVPLIVLKKSFHMDPMIPSKRCY